MNYWGYRTNKFKAEFFWKELQQGRLRQGWGFENEHDLRNPKLLYNGARRNMRMYQDVKKGDYLLVPHLPQYHEVAIVQATEDWNKGYDFRIDEKEGDYGHIFPAKFVKKFVRNNRNVSSDLQSTLKNIQRFWNITRYEDDIKILLDCPQEELIDSISYEDRLEEAIFGVFDEKTFSKNLYDGLNKEFVNETWEYALVKGLQELLPFYSIERVGGKSEKEHGTDILIKLPGIDAEISYAIAIQVKDYEGIVRDNVCAQINKADDYWKDNNDIKLIDKIVVVIRATKEQNEKLTKDYPSIRFIFAEELQEILCKIGRKVIGKAII
jgi:hypothetical protein